MHVLFVHPDFPAQFRYVAPRLARDRGWNCTFVTRTTLAKDVPGVMRIPYALGSIPGPGTHPCNRRFESTMAHALGVYDALKSRPDLKPDLVVAHGSFGSSLFLPHLYDAPILNFFEYFYRTLGQDLGYRPEQAVTELDLLRCRADNAMTLLDLENCEQAWTPTQYQRDLMPAAYRPKVEVVHDGIDAELFRRRPRAPRRLSDGTEVPDGTRVVTYVTRGFEMLRGFDLFMAAARRVLERCPDVVFAIAGGDRICYGSGNQCGGHGSFRERVTASHAHDPSRFRFLGVVPEDELANLLSISDLHVYLTAPFFTSWSVLEAMSCSCVVLASDQACTREYISHGRNGLLCDFFDVEAMAELAVRVLKDPAAHRPLGEAARRTMEQTYSVDVTLPKIKAMFERVASRPRAPSERAERLVRPGARHEPVVHDAGGRATPPPGDDLPAYDGSVPFLASTGSASPERPATPLPARARGGKVVFFCWELGGGRGHLMQMLPLAEDLARNGHEVFMVLRDLDRAAEVYGHAGVSLLAAPAWSPGARGAVREPVTYARFLLNVGFGDDGGLVGRASAWLNLFRRFRPDLIVFDHAPTALLASRAVPARRALIGSGFCCPPDHIDARGTWAVLRPRLAAMADPSALADDERRLLSRMNWVLRKWKVPTLERLGSLYGDVDENFLTTLPELDHFRVEDRGGTAYWGPVLTPPPAPGSDPQWPASGGPRVFAYLKNSPTVADVLGALATADAATVAFVDGLAPELRRRFESGTLHLADRALDLGHVAAQCDAAVLTGGHGATAEMLLAGKPVLQVPSAMEQYMTAEAVRRLGAGEQGSADDPESIRRGISAILTGERYARAARQFAERYAAFDPRRQRAAMLARCETLLDGALVKPEVVVFDFAPTAMLAALS